MSSSSFLFTLTVVEIMKINLKNWDLNPWRTKESISTFDTLQTYKIIHGFDDVKSNTWFNTVGSDEHRLTRLTADPQNLIPSRSRRNWKLIRAVNLWNSLKTLEILNCLKNIYQRYAGELVLVKIVI